MPLKSVRPDDKVVKVAFHVLMKHVVEDILHGPLVCCPDIFESEGHDFIAKDGVKKVVAASFAKIILIWLYPEVVSPSVLIDALWLTSRICFAQHMMSLFQTKSCFILHLLLLFLDLLPWMMFLNMTLRSSFIATSALRL
ncbi:hypothetical protein ACLOJK_026149 [Asimina triloba]